ETDRAEARRHQQRHPDIAVGEVRPEQRRDDEGEQDEEAAHGGRALLANEMTLWPVEADGLTLRLLRFEPGDDARPEEEADEQRGHQRAARAEGEIAEEIERSDLVGERNEEMKQHT